MKLKLLWLSGAVCSLLQAAEVATICFEELVTPFDNKDATLPEYGWQAHYGETATDFFPVPAGYVKEAQPYVRSGNYFLDNKPGEGLRDEEFSGTEPKLIWTTKIAVSDLDIADMAALHFRLTRDTAVRPALKIGGEWLTASQPIEPAGSIRLTPESLEWLELDFTPATRMELGQAASLPVNGTVEALGFYYQNSEPPDVIDDMQLQAIMVERWVEHPGLIAAESFWTTHFSQNDTFYTTGRNFRDTKAPQNQKAIAGNTGFGEYEWGNGNDRLQPATNLNLTHSGVALPTHPGCARLLVNNFKNLSHRNTWRQLDNEPPAAEAYFLSGLIQVDALDLLEGEGVAAGFDNAKGASDALTHGLHLGVRRADGGTWLTAFAGNQGFDLLELDETRLEQVWLVVLKLEPVADGPDRVSGWYAADGDRYLTLALNEQLVETWQNAASLGALRLTTRALGRTGNDSDAASPIWVDEICLGVTLESVTALSIPPSPGTTILIR